MPGKTQPCPAKASDVLQNSAMPGSVRGRRVKHSLPERSINTILFPFQRRFGIGRNGHWRKEIREISAENFPPYRRTLPRSCLKI